MNRLVRDHLKRLHFALYKHALRLGVHIIPAHYYAPLPNIIGLKRSQNLWAKPSAMAGIEIDLDAQVADLRAVCTPFAPEFSGNPHYRHAINQPFPSGRSRFFGYIEAQVLHAVIRHYKPARIIEIGGGVPSYCNAAAIARNGAGHIICIEPDPVDLVKQLACGRQNFCDSCPDGNFELMARPIQEVPLKTFTQLEPNDIVFIDSNHVVKTGGEVNYIVLEILPILPPGVLVQFHDVYLPYDYERDVLHSFLPPNETTLLAAFLACNSRYKILFALSMLHYYRQREMQSVLTEYQPEADWHGMRVGDYDPAKHFPSSLWLRVEEDER